MTNGGKLTQPSGTSNGTTSHNAHEPTCPEQVVLVGDDGRKRRYDALIANVRKTLPHLLPGLHPVTTGHSGQVVDYDAMHKNIVTLTDRLSSIPTGVVPGPDSGTTGHIAHEPNSPEQVVDQDAIKRANVSDASQASLADLSKVVPRVVSALKPVHPPTPPSQSRLAGPSSGATTLQTDARPQAQGTQQQQNQLQQQYQQPQAQQQTRQQAAQQAPKLHYSRQGQGGIQPLPPQVQQTQQQLLQQHMARQQQLSIANQKPQYANSSRPPAPPALPAGNGTTRHNGHEADASDRPNTLLLM
ncbi:hypothetical protein B0H66DRAFT_98836 [Apodospora peruviana]|uniref:Uncharacterized protein n=1 Tax=Apodospora peruviana TaxID=516989 RepID=A0AAE0IUG0_9PEZI|nr:hypothetical protein B0H66DRAFT_98836 [Apodospora peruviana]